jgi:hypothetical protein
VCCVVLSYPYVIKRGLTKRSAPFLYRRNMGIQLIFRNKERQMHGSGAKGRFIPAEKGRRSIYVPSFGALEKEEVDYMVEAAQEQEDERVRKGSKSEIKENLEVVADAARRAPRGQRAKTAKEIIKTNARWV